MFCLGFGPQVLGFGLFVVAVLLLALLHRRARMHNYSPGHTDTAVDEIILLCADEKHRPREYAKALYIYPRQAKSQDTTMLVEKGNKIL